MNYSIKTEGTNRSHGDILQIIARRKKELTSKFAEEKCAFVSPVDLTYGSSRVHQTLIEGADVNT